MSEINCIAWWFMSLWPTKWQKIKRILLYRIIHLWNGYILLCLQYKKFHLKISENLSNAVEYKTIYFIINICSSVGTTFTFKTIDYIVLIKRKVATLELIKGITLKKN